MSRKRRELFTKPERRRQASDFSNKAKRMTNSRLPCSGWCRLALGHGGSTNAGARSPPKVCAVRHSARALQHSYISSILLRTDARRPHSSTVMATLAEGMPLAMITRILAPVLVPVITSKFGAHNFAANGMLRPKIAAVLPALNLVFRILCA